MMMLGDCVPDEWPWRNNVFGEVAVDRRLEVDQRVQQPRCNRLRLSAGIGRLSSVKKTAAWAGGASYRPDNIADLAGRIADQG
jgi:hypothetical protein